MRDDLEDRLHAALRPVTPSEEFTQKLVARVTAGQQPKRRRAAWHGLNPAAWWISAGVAASMLIAVGLQRHLQELRDRESGLKARREVVEALRMTSQKLNLAYEAVKIRGDSS